MIFVIIVAVAWMVILGPSLMRRRSRAGGEIGSISHFHQQLRVLEHSAPQPIVAPAYRLRAVDGGADPGQGPGCPGVAAAPVLTVVGADQLPRPALAFLGEALSESSDQTVSVDASPGGGPGDQIGDTGAAGAGRGAPVRAVDPLARHVVRRRRRDTLGVLAVVFVGTMMIGFVPGAGVAWVLTALSGAALAAYVALLVRLRRTAEEREKKLRYFRPGGSGRADEDAVARMPVTMSGRYAHPSNQAVAAR